MIYFPDAQNVRLLTDGISGQTSVEGGGISHFVIPQIGKRQRSRYNIATRYRISADVISRVRRNVIIGGSALFYGLHSFEARNTPGAYLSSPLEASVLAATLGTFVGYHVESNARIYTKSAGRARREVIKIPEQQITLSYPQQLITA